MQTRTLFAIIPLCGVTAIAIAYLFYALRWSWDGLPNCAVMRAYDVRVVVHYPSGFKDVSHPHSIDLKQQLDQNDPAKLSDEYTLTIEAEGFREELTDIIGHRPGPWYASSTFDGRPAGFADLPESKVGTWNIYKFPVGDNTLMVSYLTDQLSPDLKRLTDKMLRNITVTRVNDDAKPTNAGIADESCGLEF